MASGNLETEIKLRVSGPQAARQVLTNLGASLQRPRHFEVNVLWDDAAGSLRSRGHLLRVRETEAGGVLTFKGERRDQDGVKGREEIETTVSDTVHLALILGALGLMPRFRYEKYREIYRWRDAELMVDETPMGTFLEIEGPPASIHAAAQAAGFTRADYVTESYPALFFAAGGQGDMVFP